MKVFYCSEIEHLVRIIEIILDKKSDTDNEKYEYKENELCRICTE